MSMYEAEQLDPDDIIHIKYRYVDGDDESARDGIARYLGDHWRLDDEKYPAFYATLMYID